MSQYFEDLNDKLKEYKPTSLILGTAGSLTVGLGLFKLFTHPKGIKYILFKAVQSIPGVDEKIEKDTDKLVKETCSTILKLSDPVSKTLPSSGIPRKELLERLKKMISEEEEHHKGLTSRYDG
jgi:hypothetical protein